MLLLKSPATSFALRRSVSVFSTSRVATYPHTLHEYTRRHSTGLPQSAPHVWLSSRPPFKFTPNPTEPNSPEEISDLEWEIRTGRAIYVLERTLPDFFRVGLVANVDPTRPDIVDVPVSESGLVERIYSPTVRLTYTPPVALPPPFPRTLSLEGLALYMTSSVFIRHTMKTLYSDLRVEMRKLVVHTPRRREKSVFVGLNVYGTTRVSGGLGEWQIDSTYTFSPLTGRIQLHSVDSIRPAPHQTAYDALVDIFGMAPGSTGIHMDRFIDIT